MTARPFVVVLIAALAAETGCGTEDGDARRAHTTVSPPPTTMPNPTLDPPARDYSREAERFVRSHYRTLNRREFEEAWEHLSPEAQATLGPFQQWVSGYELTEGTTPATVAALNADSRHARVSVELNSDDLDECGNHVPQHFEGTWTLRRTAGKWSAVSAVITKTGGGEPVRDPAQCIDWTTVDPPTGYEPPDAGFTYLPNPDPGEPLYLPPADFCATHDCIPNFYNGTGYPTQCADGTWSNSGGRPGACSWHGGLAP